MLKRRKAKKGSRNRRVETGAGRERGVKITRLMLFLFFKRIIIPISLRIIFDLSKLGESFLIPRTFHSKGMENAFEYHAIGMHPENWSMQTDLSYKD